MMDRDQALALLATSRHIGLTAREARRDGT